MQAGLDVPHRLPDVIVGFHICIDGPQSAENLLGELTEDLVVPDHWHTVDPGLEVRFVNLSEI